MAAFIILVDGTPGGEGRVGNIDILENPLKKLLEGLDELHISCDDTEACRVSFKLDSKKYTILFKTEDTGYRYIIGWLGDDMSTPITICLSDEYILSPDEIVAWRKSLLILPAEKPIPAVVKRHEIEAVISSNERGAYPFILAKRYFSDKKYIVEINSAETELSIGNRITGMQVSVYMDKTPGAIFKTIVLTYSYNKHVLRNIEASCIVTAEWIDALRSEFDSLEASTLLSPVKIKSEPAAKTKSSGEHPLQRIKYQTDLQDGRRAGLVAVVALAVLGSLYVLDPNNNAISANGAVSGARRQPLVLQPNHVHHTCHTFAATIQSEANALPDVLERLTVDLHYKPTISSLDAESYRARILAEAASLNRSAEANQIFISRIGSFAPRSGDEVQLTTCDGGKSGEVLYYALPGNVVIYSFHY